MSRRKPIPAQLDEEEARFLSNWRNEVSSLHTLLTSVAADRLRVLRRARRFYFKLAHKLADEIHKPAAHPASRRPQ